MEKEDKEIESSNYSRDPSEKLHTCWEPSWIQYEWCKFCKGIRKKIPGKGDHMIKMYGNKMVWLCPGKLVQFSGNGAVQDGCQEIGIKEQTKPSGMWCEYWRQLEVLKVGLLT